MLPRDVFHSLTAALSDMVNSSHVHVPCMARILEGTLNFGFGGSDGPVIRVNLSEFILPVSRADIAPLPRSQYQDTDLCTFGISELDPDSSAVFGDTFLRSAYVVYDLYNNKIALAQANFDPDGSNVIAFESYGAAIPSATFVTPEVSFTTVATGTSAPTASLRDGARFAGPSKGFGA